jgi:flagellar basal-body rod protein FlgG
MSGARTQNIALEMTANNISNANTHGFKANRLVFEEVLKESEDGLEMASESQVRVAKNYTDLRQGMMDKTGNPLDLAIAGDGFFVVNTPGGERYTRAGAFTISAEGYLVNAQGYRVQGEGGDIDLRDPRGLRVDNEGNVTKRGRLLDTLRVVSFAEPQKIEREGHNLWTNPPTNEVLTSKVSIKTGWLEKSNVNPIRSMTNMIQISRLYEMFMKGIQTFQKIDEKTTQQLSR